MRDHVIIITTVCMFFAIVLGCIKLYIDLKKEDEDLNCTNLMIGLTVASIWGMLGWVGFIVIITNL